MYLEFIHISNTIAYPKLIKSVDDYSLGGTTDVEPDKSLTWLLRINEPNVAPKTYGYSYLIDVDILNNTTDGDHEHEFMVEIKAEVEKLRLKEFISKI